MPADIHYVKFYRGSSAAYEALKTAHRIDSDTLYFVYTNPAASRGLLYLGEKLISGSDEGGVVQDISLADLADVEIDGETLENHQILAYDSSTDSWQNTSLEDILASAVMTGATSVSNGRAGLVPKPYIADRNKFLKGDGTWATVEVPTFNPNQFETDGQNRIILKGSGNLEANQIPMSDGNGGIHWASAAIGTLQREVVNSVNDIDLTDTDKIYFVRKSGQTPADDSYEEYIVINGNAERLGSSSVNLSGYATVAFVNQEIQTLTDILQDTQTTDPETGDPVTVPGLISNVNSLLVTQSAIGDLSDYINNDTTLVERIEEINQKLTWNELDS